MPSPPFSVGKGIMFLGCACVFREPDIWLSCSTLHDNIFSRFIQYGLVTDGQTNGLRATEYNAVACGAVAEWVESIGLTINRSWVQILLSCVTGASCSHLCAFVIKQYNLVPAKERWCSAAGNVTAGLAENNGSLQPGVWLPIHWDQPRAHRSVTSMGSLCLYRVTYH